MDKLAASQTSSSSNQLLSTSNSKTLPSLSSDNKEFSVGMMATIGGWHGGFVFVGFCYQCSLLYFYGTCIYGQNPFCYLAT